MNINVKDRKVRYDPHVTIFLEVTVNDVTETLECDGSFPDTMSELAYSTPGLGGCHVYGKLKEQLTKLGLIRRSTRGSHNRTKILTRAMAIEMIASFEEEFQPMMERMNSFSPGETIPTLDEMEKQP